MVGKVLDYRSLQKLRSTYVDALPLLIRSDSGRIHTSFNQAVTATGRLSSTNPNMQNIPIRTEKGRYIRKAFVARDADHELLSADYSQRELRLIAHISHEEAMMEAFMQHADIHASTAAKIYNVSLPEVSQEMRRKAKVVNFGIIYGISGWGLAERLGISRKESEDIISQYFIKFPGIKKYMNETIEMARSRGYVETLLGRKRYIRDINSRNQTQRGFAERNAINAPIQGSAADMIKIAMVEIDREMTGRKLKSSMIMQVHDELVFDAHTSEVDELLQLVKNLMENAMQLDIPVVVEAGRGLNWLDAH
jgi:DNA polymerase-1